MQLPSIDHLYTVCWPVTALPSIPSCSVDPVYPVLQRRSRLSRPAPSIPSIPSASSVLSCRVSRLCYPVICPVYPVLQRLSRLSRPAASILSIPTYRLSRPAVCPSIPSCRLSHSDPLNWVLIAAATALPPHSVVLPLCWGPRQTRF